MTGSATARRSGTGRREKITRDDLERTFQSFQDTIQGKVDEQRPKLLTAGIGVTIVVLLLVFFLGRRAGAKKTTLVEIRRV